MTRTTSDGRRLDALTPFVLHHLPPAPARVIELGCGPLGGFVPELSIQGYDVTGIDPEAPEGPAYRTIEFEAYDVRKPVDAIVACVSLHHVRDLERVLDKVADCLVPGAVTVVAEWAYERFDEPTARWCFDRLGPPEETGWLHRHRDSWQASGLSWEPYLEDWADAEGLHGGDTIIQALWARLETRVLTRAPYVFPDLHETSGADEQAAIDTGLIRPTGIRYVGRRAWAANADLRPGRGTPPGQHPRRRPQHPRTGVAERPDGVRLSRRSGDGCLPHLRRPEATEEDVAAA